jgi:hypothetical protein
MTGPKFLSQGLIMKSVLLHRFRNVFNWSVFKLRLERCLMRGGYLRCASFRVFSNEVMLSSIERGVGGGSHPFSKHRSVDGSRH